MDVIKEPLNITPVEAFLRLRGTLLPFIFSWAYGKERFSFLSSEPFITIIADGDGAKALEGNVKRSYVDPFEALSEVMRGFKKGPHDSPFPFNCGAFGYFSYDLREKIEPRFSGSKKDDPLRLPYSVIGVYDPVFVYSHGESRGYIVSTLEDSARISRFKELLSKDAAGAMEAALPPAAGFSSNVTKEEYLSCIRKAQRYISAGDIYQINLSQRLAIPWAGDPFALYINLLNPESAPFLSFLDAGSFQIISNSPERLLKVSGSVVETSPIKGTRPRGSTPEEDRKLIEELKSSGKERAEHVMIVDLERNDIGKISVPGTVAVAEFERIETFPALHHMVSTVRGRLKGRVDAPAALKSVFPGGSITGAPKIRAMEIIDELEPEKRGVYTGGIGWMDFTGTMDIAMAIRTAVCKDGVLHLSVGGGIVADSGPEAEYDETILKAKDFLDLMGIKAVNR